MNTITYTIEVEPEECSVRGNALASGDDAADRACENEILARLARGDTWAWCSVRVVATFASGQATMMITSDWLGCCSYQDENDFKAGGYFYDMVRAIGDTIRAANKVAL